MSYDYHGTWNTVTGHNSPLFPLLNDSGNAAQYNVVRLRRHFVCLLLNGTSAICRLKMPRIVEIEHVRHVKNNV